MIKEFTVQDLFAAINEDKLWESNVLPINKHRIFSLVENPNVSNSDITLLVAYYNDQISAYLTITPDIIKGKKNNHRIGWLGTYYADPENNNPLLTLKLIYRAYELYEGKLATFSGTIRALGILKSTNKFKTLKESKGYHYFIRSNLYSWLPKKSSSWIRLKMILLIFDTLLNIFLDRRIWVWKKRHALSNKLKFEYLLEIHDDKSKEFIKKHSHNHLSPKNFQSLNSIVKNPDDLPSYLKDSIKEKYHFSQDYSDYRMCFLKVLDDMNNILAILVIKIAGDNLFIPFLYCSTANTNVIARVIFHHIGKLKYSMFTTFNNDIIKSFSDQKIPYMIKRNRTRLSLISKIIKEDGISGYVLQDGDGA